MFPGLLPDVVEGPLLRPGRTVGTVGPQRIPHVCDSEDAGREGALVSPQPTRTSGSSPLLVMTIGDVERWTQVRDRRKERNGEHRVLFHHDPLVIRERRWFKYDA